MLLKPMIHLNQNDLFRRTRWRLTAWYAGVMGIILSLSALGIYEAIAHAHRVTSDRELQSVATTLHNGLELTLQQQGQLDVASQQLLPGLCLTRQSGETASCVPQTVSSERHLLSAIDRGRYYIRLLDRSGQLVAQAGQPPNGLPATPATDGDWHLLYDRDRSRYRQISLSLHTRTHLPWGVLQVGRSLQDFDTYLDSVRWIIVLSLPLAMLGVGAASWKLAGLAMGPIYESYQKVQQFTADAAHELRTPLAAILATVESALRIQHFSAADARETLHVVERQNQRLSQLVSDLLLLSRLDRQVQAGQFRLCCLQDLLSDLEEELAALAIASQITLTFAIEPQRPVQVRGVEEQLYRLFFNVVANAIQYTPAGGQVSVNLKDDSDRASTNVQDTGIGISPDQQAKIFDRFYRVESDRSRDTGGSGLGLSIARAIAQAHQGSIQVQSEVGKGSKFTIRLPKY